MNQGQDSTPTPSPSPVAATDTPPAPARYSDLRGVGRAMAILEVVSEAPRRAKEIASVLDLKWTTAYRTLAHLEEQEYLRRDPSTNEYAVGARLYALGLAYLRDHALLHLSQPHLEHLAHTLNCVAQVNERQARQVLTIALAEGPSRIPKTSAGFTFPLGIAAKGRLLLAFAPDEVVEETLSHPLPALTPSSTTDPEQLRKELQQIRDAGCAVTSDDLQIGVGSIAVPIRDRDNEVCACVSLVVPSARLADEADRELLLDGARQAGRALSIGIGWLPRQ